MSHTNTLQIFQVEDAEGLATGNLTKYKQLQHQLEDAVRLKFNKLFNDKYLQEERADLAENHLAKIRLKSRSGSMLTVRSGLMHSVGFLYEFLMCCFVMAKRSSKNSF